MDQSSEMILGPSFFFRCFGRVFRSLLGCVKTAGETRFVRREQVFNNPGPQILHEDVPTVGCVQRTSESETSEDRFPSANH